MSARLDGLRLAAVVAHPDDEAWALGGTLALCAAQGAEVRVICATAGAGSLAAKHPADDVAALRTIELMASCAALGIGRPVMLGWEDGGLAAMDSWRAVQDLRAALRELEPDAVVGLGPEGGYAHKDHTALHAMLREAVGSTSSGRQPRLFELALPPNLMTPVRRAIRRIAPDIIDAGVGNLGVPYDRPDLHVDIKGVAKAKLAAVSAHASQLPPRGAERFLGGTVMRMLEVERFVQVAGDPLAEGAATPLG